MESLFHLVVKTRSGTEYAFGENGCVLRTTTDGKTEFLGVMTSHFAEVGLPMSITVVLCKNSELIRETWTTTDVTLISSAISLEELVEKPRHNVTHPSHLIPANW